VSPAPRAVLRTLVLAGLLVLCVPARGSAEWQFAPFLGYTFRGATTLYVQDAAEQRHWHIGGAVKIIGEGPLGVEGLLVYTPAFFQFRGDAIQEVRVTSSRTVALMGNAVVTAPRHWTQYGLRPYVSGGIGLLHASADDLLNVLPIDLNLLGMNAGGGAVGFITDRVGLRFDLRYIRAIHGPSPEELEVPVTSFQPVRLRYWTGSVGIVFRY
jgi:hypothetical protein